MKRMIYLILWVLIIVSFVHSIPKRQLGDINNDGKVTTTDLVMLRRYLSDEVDLSVYKLRRSDLNNDGVVNEIDLYLLRLNLAGNKSNH